MAWVSKIGFKSNKPIHYLLDSRPTNFTLILKFHLKSFLRFRSMSKRVIITHIHANKLVTTNLQSGPWPCFSRNLCCVCGALPLNNFFFFPVLEKLGLLGVSQRAAMCSSELLVSKLPLQPNRNYIVCVNFKHECRNLNFKIYSEWQISENLFVAILFSFPAICWEPVAEEIFFHILFC